MACCLIITVISYLKKINFKISRVLRPLNPHTLFLIILLLLIPIGLFSQEDTAITRREIEEDPAEFMSLSLGDSEVELFITGTWKGAVQTNIGLGFTPLGAVFKSPESLFLFTQEADLSLSLWINNKWFVEANVHDKFKDNTYRAGFQGEPGDFIQYMGIGNTGLDFPSFPYLDLGGGSTSSFGYYGRMGNENFGIHSLIRYDTAAREERIFTGGREKTVILTEPGDYIRAVSFVLPDKNIESEILVFIEDEKGALIDNNGRRWRQALHSEYAAGARDGLLELGIRPQGMVAASYANVEGGLLSGYTGSVFLKEVNDYFKDIDLSLNPSFAPSFIQIDGVKSQAVKALVLYEPGRFSPFEKLSRYDAPSSASEEASVIRLSTGSARNDFELVQLSSNSTTVDTPLYMQTETRRFVYELLSVNKKDARDPAARWPLASFYPEIYFPARDNYSGDTVLRFVNYSDSSGFFIGTDVVEGSVQVYRSGIQDSNFRFNSGSGEVTLFTPAGLNETIRITYLRKSEDTNLGSIAAGLGIIYQKPNNPFSAQAALGVRWNLTERDAFTEEGSSSLGVIGASGKANWDFDNLKASVSAGFAYEQPDTTGLYRAAGMEGNEIVLHLSSDDSFLSHAPPSFDPSKRADLIYRNYFNSSVLGDSLKNIWESSAVISGLNRPYLVKDPALGDRPLLAAEFDLAQGNWTGYQLPLGENSDFVSRAREILIPYRLYGFGETLPVNLRVILQIGSLSPKDFTIEENMDLILQIEINLANASLTGTIQSITITPDQRQKLAGANHIRLIIVNESGSSVAGRVLLAPPIIRGASFRPVIFENDSVKSAGFFANNVLAYETHETQKPFLEDTFPDIIKRLHPGDSNQRVLKIEWEDMRQGASAGADGRIADMPLKNYRELSFFIKPPDTGEKLRFIIAGSSESLDKPVLQSEIPLNEFTPGVWSKVTIRYNDTEKSVRINGNIINKDITYIPQNLNLQTNTSCYAVFFIDPADSSSELEDAVMYIDEIILEDALNSYRINAGASFEYKKDGTILSIGKTSAVSDFKIASAAESEIRINNIEGGNNDITSGIVNRTGMCVSFFGVKLETNAAFLARDNSLTWSADHAVSKSIGAFSIKEQFYASPFDNNIRHNLNMSYASSFHAKFNAEALYEASKLKQNWNIGTGCRPKNDLFPSFEFNTDFSWINNEQLNENYNYAVLWAGSWEPLLPDTGRGADARNALSRIIINQRTKPVGAVLTLQGGSVFTSVNNLTKLDSSLFLDIPVALKNADLNFRSGRQYRKHINFSGRDAIDDTVKFFESINESLPLWGGIPFYSLFSPNLNKKMDSVLYNSNTKETGVFNSFSDHFSASLNLQRRGDLTSLFVPVRATIRLERNLEQKMDTRADLLNLGAGLSFSAINLFGSMGYKPVFNFYRTDEFNHSIQLAMVFNRYEDVLWRVQSNLGAGFRMREGDVNFENTFTLRNSANSKWVYWTESVAAGWTSPAEKTLTGLLYKWISNGFSGRNSWPALSSLLSSDYEQLRKESLEIVFDKSGDYLKWRIILGHEEIIRILGRLEFTGFAKLRFTDDRHMETFIIDLLIGTTLRINF